MSAPVLRIIARRLPWPDHRARPDRSGLRLRWDALDEDGALLVEATTHPFVDAAFVLMQRGGDPDALVTMRHEGADHDSFAPTRLHIVAAAGAKRAAAAEAARNRLRPARHHEGSATTASAGISAPATASGDPLTPSEGGE